MTPDILRRLSVAFAALALAAGLSGCALTGGGARAQLYRFGAESAAGAPASAPTRTVGITALEFQPAAAGDRLLAVQDQQVFYVSGARWVSRAEELFIQAAERAFSRAGLRLSRRGLPFDPDAGLVLAVPVFETRYLSGAEAAPTVVIEVRASVLATADRAILGERTFTVNQPASGNTVTQIVAAYDAASGQALDQVAAWAATTAARPAA